jgi:hypothetical protein
MEHMYKEKLKVHFNQGSKVLTFYSVRELNTAMAFYKEHGIRFERR